MLVETLIDFNQKRNISVSKDELTIIPGATYGIYTAIASIIEYGDENLAMTVMFLL